MKKLLISASAIMFLAGTAYAQDITTKPVMNGSVEVEVKENSAGDYAATTTFGLGVEVGSIAYGSASVESINGNTFEIDEWQIGTMLGSLDLSFGDQGGMFVESWSDYSSIIDPEMAESVAVRAGDLAFAVGFTDITNDISDISNIQGAYTLGVDVVEVTASADYNFNSDDWAVGTRAEGIQLAGIDLGSTMSYGSAADELAYEVDGTLMGITAYVNGDQNDILENIGAGYDFGYGNMAIGTDINYNVDSEKLSPKVALKLNF